MDTMREPNVLLVVLDSVRAKNTSLHEHPVETTPNVEALAEEATSYRQARSPGIHSIASHVSIFTGHHVAEHGLYEHESRLRPEASVWTELARDHGYETGLFTPNVIVAETSNLADHFEYTAGPKRWTHPEEGLTIPDLDGNVSTRRFLAEAIRHKRPIRSLLNGVHYKLFDKGAHDPAAERAEVYVEEFFNWQDQRDGPWAACLNLMDAHYPYVAQPEHRLYDDEKLREMAEYFDGPLSEQVLSSGGWWALEALEYLYDECIGQVDAAVGTLLNGLRRRGEYQDTLIVVTSDHGEAFGEHSQVSPSVRLCDHSWGIHEVQTHVPLVVKHPGRTEQERVDEVASLTEFPTVVRRTLAGDGVPTFCPDSGHVLASTYRVPPPGIELPDDVDEVTYLGPWRAVYEGTDSGVRKRATHGDDGATIRVDSARSWHVESRAYPTEVDDVYAGLADTGVGDGTACTSAEAEERLQALGYMR